MQQRCENPNNTAYKHYGGRGISICERWRVFENFLADMGERPADMSLDRIDCNGNYEPGNCRWATRKTQHRNTRQTRRIEYEGEVYCLRDLAAKLGVQEQTLRVRMELGWPPNEWGGPSRAPASHVSRRYKRSSP